MDLLFHLDNNILLDNLIKFYHLSNIFLRYMVGKLIFFYLYLVEYKIHIFIFVIYLLVFLYLIHINQIKLFLDKDLLHKNIILDKFFILNLRMLIQHKYYLHKFLVDNV